MKAGNGEGGKIVTVCKMKCIIQKCTVLTSSLSRTKVMCVCVCVVCVCVLYVGIGSKQCVSVCGSSCPRFPTLQGRSLPDAIISIGMHIL